MNQLKAPYRPVHYLSLYQVKYLLSVVSEYEFVCPAPIFFYDPVTYKPKFCFDRLDLVFGADFLIRHRETGEALLVDIYPTQMGSDPRIIMRRQIAENCIAFKGHDWQYQSVFEQKIVLTANEQTLYDSYRQMQDDQERLQWLLEYLSFCDLLKPPVFQSPAYSLLDFLIHGVLPAHF